MSSSDWREPILSRFTPELAEVCPVTIALDPEEVLREEDVLRHIRNAGFEAVEWTDPVEFRFTYERRFRARWDAGEHAPLVLIAGLRWAERNQLPWDMLNLATRDRRLLRFRLGEFFPGVSARVLRELPRGDLDAVHQAVERVGPEDLGDAETRAFLLRHVYHVDPAGIQRPEALLLRLLELHYESRGLPAPVVGWFAGALSERFVDWPVETLTASPDAFYGFLQERWDAFVFMHTEDESNGGGAGSSRPFRYPGPTDLPFEGPAVRAILDDLFADGVLERTPGVPVRKAPAWMHFGVADGGLDGVEARLDMRLEALSDPPGLTAGHGEWTAYAVQWAEIACLRAECETRGMIHHRASSLWDRLDARFRAWMEKNYAILETCAPVRRPVMVHHVPPYLAHRRARDSRTALVVLDGISLSQWRRMRQALSDQGVTPRVDTAVFAWAPTITSVSRQALFAGSPPYAFEPTLDTTRKEKDRWTAFWESRGVGPEEVRFLPARANEPDEALLKRVEKAVYSSRCRVLGLVVNRVDEIIHGATLGASGAHGQVQHWAEGGGFTRLITMLLEADFHVAVASDHGNIEARGFGTPNLGVVVTTRGKRSQVFPTRATLEQASRDIEPAFAWTNAGLPEGWFVLLAAGRGCFAPVGSRHVTHGGISLEEVIVPFAEFRPEGS